MTDNELDNSGGHERPKSDLPRAPLRDPHRSGEELSDLWGEEIDPA